MSKLQRVAMVLALVWGGESWAAEVTVRGVGLQETNQGFSIRVVCNDANEKPGHYYWDRALSQSFSGLSERCNVTLEEARRGILISPAVAFKVSESSHGFELIGPFKQGAYSVSLLPGLKSVSGATTSSRTEKTLVVPPASRA